MNFTCDNCQKRYSIADEKVRGKTVKVRCKNCQNVITVEGPAEEESTRVVSLADVERIRAQERSLAGGGGAAAAPAPAPVAAAAAPAPLARPPASAPQTPWDDEPTRTAPPRQTAGAPWFVMVRNKQEGPLDETAVAEWMAAGTISARSFFWRQGMPDWKRGSDIPELAALLAPAASRSPSSPSTRRTSPVPPRTTTVGSSATATRRRARSSATTVRRPPRCPRPLRAVRRRRPWRRPLPRAVRPSTSCSPTWTCLATGATARTRRTPVRTRRAKIRAATTRRRRTRARWTRRPRASVRWCPRAVAAR
nr:GYF domain-containing protein [Corallococcus exercitus]